MKLKILFVTFLLAFALFALIIMIDLFMGTKISYLIKKESNPFQVMEPAEFAMLYLFLFGIVGFALFSFFKKRKKKAKG
jgi:uncharacterized membrane protein YwaF